MSLFSKLQQIFSTKQYPTGAFDGELDSRTIHLSMFQPPVSIPKKYVTEMPPVENQSPKNDCVGRGVHKVVELYLKQKGKDVNLSARDVYKQCKAVDGVPGSQGTFVSVGVHVAYKNGIATEALVPSDTSLKEEVYIGYQDTPEIIASRAQYKTGGYGVVARDYGAVCQSIYQNKAILCSLLVDNNWFFGKITRVFKDLGRHCVVLHGYDQEKLSVIGQNSWGTLWIGYIAGIVDKSIAPGHFEALWTDIEPGLMDLFSVTDVPTKLIEEARAQEHVFNIDLKIGAKGIEVKRLQERLAKEGFYLGVVDGDFGNKTKQALIAYQMLHNIEPASGILGPKTRFSLNQRSSKKKSLSSIGFELIKQFEGLHDGNKATVRLEPQKDAVGLYTLGYGARYDKDGKLVTEATKAISKAEAEALLRRDISIAELFVDKVVTCPLSQNQYDALCSLVYNIGSGNFERSTLLQNINNGAPVTEGNFTSWSYARKDGQLVQFKGLINRRKAEYALFSKREV